MSISADAQTIEESNPKSIFLISYPKIIFLYPTLLTSIFATVWTFFLPEERSSQIISLIFLVILAANMIVLSFDFPRTTSLTLVFFIIALSVSVWMLFSFYPDLLPFVGKFVNSFRPLANYHFYGLFSGFLILIFLGVWGSRMFDYWEVRPNELLHHHGMMSDLERFAAPQLRIDKEINDVFEFMLLGAGRLILHPNNEPRAIVLENVFFINSKEREITKMLGALQVQVRKN